MSDAKARWCGNTLRQMDQVNQAVAEWKRRIALENAVREFLAWADPPWELAAIPHGAWHALARKLEPLRAALEKRRRG
jgi:hypothetical protein